MKIYNNKNSRLYQGTHGRGIKAGIYLQRTDSDDNKRTFSYTVSDNKLFLGIPSVYYISRGEWNDPWIEYNNNVYNYYDIEDWLWGDYEDWSSMSGETATDDGYDDYINNNISAADITGIIEELTPFANVVETSGDFHWAKEI